MIRTALQEVSALQRSFDGMETSGDPVKCNKAFGGVQPFARTLPKGTNWKTGLRMTKAMELIGESAASCLINYYGPADGPPAIEIYENTGPQNAVVQAVKIANLQINCVNGARAIAVNPSVKSLEDLTIENVTTNGAIDLGCEQYSTLLNNVNLVANKRQALLIGGGAVNTFRNLYVHGNVFDPNLRAVVETHGSLTIQDSWFEDFNDNQASKDIAPMCYFGDWVTVSKDGPYSHRGGVSILGDTHFEAHHDHPSFVVVETADVYATDVGGTEKWPWRFDNRATMFLQKDPHNPQTVITTDGTGSLFVRGVQKFGPTPNT